MTTEPATETYTAVIPDWVPPYQLSANGRLHWAAKRRLDHDARWRAVDAFAGEAWPHQGAASPTWQLTITMYRVRLLDEDNAAAVCKSLIDQVRHECLVDDSPRYLHLEVRQVKAPKAEQRTILELVVPR